MEQQPGAADKIKPGAEMDPFTSHLEEVSILSQLPAAVYVCDMSGTIRYYNEKAAEIWGRHPVPGDSGPLLPHSESPVAACLKDGIARKDITVVIERPDLSHVHLRGHVAPLRDKNGKQVGVVSCLFDTNENRELAASLEDKVKEQTLDLQRRTEELRESQERYLKMVEEVEDYAIILLDRNGIIQNWNKGAEKIKGYKEEEIVGKSFQEFYLPEDREKGLPLQLLQEATDKGKAIHEGWRRRKDGSRLWGSIVLTALHDEKKNIIGFSKVTRDLTDRKIIQDKMQEYLAQLEFQNKELEQFTYVASHDLKEPLRKIHLYNSYIAGNPNNQLDTKSKEYLERSIQATNRMKGLIEDLLAYSRLASDAEAYQDVNLNTVIEEIIADYKDETVNIEKAPLPVIRAVPFQIKQLLSNLISNAVKYRSPDRDLRVKIACRAMEQYFQISVSDNGIGFDPEFKDKIFDIFQRLSNGAQINGSGIGLAICKRIVQNHKGFIEASGGLDEGATFKVYLPKPD